MERVFFLASGVFGFLTVAFGAFGAHALRSRFSGLADGPSRLEWWQTATLYQAVHALALALAAHLSARTSSTAATVAGVSFGVGIVLFSGSLYTMALTGVRALGAVTPLGGLAFLIGWAAIVWSALKIS
jgi:uncharacterized membrane protein YgdD (TMEM256/DUF423 family)